MKQAFRTTLRVAEGGRIVIPADVRESLGMEIGADVVLTVEEDRATLMSPKVARQRARERVGRFISSGISLRKELQTERKAEAARE